jgi:hypothetical protein
VQTLQHVLFLVNEHRLHGRVEVGERSWTSCLQTGCVVDVFVELPQIFNSVDYSWGRPRSGDFVWVKRPKPGRQGTWIATSNNHPLMLSWQLSIVPVDKAGHISQSLSRIKPLQVFSAPSPVCITKGLRSSIIPMFMDYN